MGAHEHPMEGERLAVLALYGPQRTDAGLDELVAYASEVCEAPVSVITSIAQDRQWFRTKIGTDLDGTPRDVSFCAHAILQEGLLEIHDATQDDRFVDNPFVTDEPHVRFYAGVPIRSSEGLPLGTICVLDVKPRRLNDFQRRTLQMLARQAESRLELLRRDQELKVERDFVRVITDHLPVRVAYIDPEFRYQFVNGAYELSFGVPRSQFLGRTIGEVMGEELFKVGRPYIERALAGEAYSADFAFTFEGSPRWVRATYSPDVGEDGRIKGVVTHALDITENRRMELALAEERAHLAQTLEALRESEEKRRLALESAGIGAWNIDLSTPTPTLGTDSRFRAICSGTDNPLSFEEAFSRIHPDDRQMVRDRVATACLPVGAVPYALEYRVIHFDGSIHWVFAQGRANFRGEGAQSVPLTFDGTVLEITERKRTEEERERLVAELARQTALWDSALSNISEFVFVFDREVRFRYANRALVDLWKFPAEVVIGKSCEDLSYPLELAQQVRQDARTVFEEKRQVGGELVFDGSIGAPITFEYTLAPIFAPDGSVEAIAGSSRDVTQRNTTLNALRQSEERFRAIQDTTPNAFTILEAVRDESGAVVDFRWIYVNAATSRLTGESNEELMGALASERRPGIRETELYQAWLQTIESGEPYTIEMPMLFPSGRAFLRLTGVRVGDGIATSFVDLTHRQRNEEQLREAVEERTAELRNSVREAEAFNYSISHDLRSPLRAMASTSSILLEDAGPELLPEHRRLLERQNENAKRLGRLIDELLYLSRLARAEVRRRPIDVSAIAGEVAATMEGCCEFVIQEGMSANADPELIRTVLDNLIGNACKFSPDKGKIEVAESDGVFRVRDEGVGFDPDFVHKIFLPFERLVTDKEFPGTGIGLANVDRIVRRHNGRIWAESQPGQGATFFFTLE